MFKSLISSTVNRKTLYLCLACGELLIKIFGKNGIRILTQILGFFILAISIQLLTDSIFAVLQKSGWS